VISNAPRTGQVRVSRGDAREPAHFRRARAPAPPARPDAWPRGSAARPPRRCAESPCAGLSAVEIDVNRRHGSGAVVSDRMPSPVAGSSDEEARAEVEDAAYKAPPRRHSGAGARTAECLTRDAHWMPPPLPDSRRDAHSRDS
jgi:hypothetical protein